MVLVGRPVVPSFRRPVVPSIVALLIGISACGSPDLMLPSAHSGVTLAPEASDGFLIASCGNPNSTGYIPDCWPQGYVIRLQPAPLAFQSQQQAAVDDWNFYLTQNSLTPRFQVNDGSHLDDVKTSGVESGSSYCGTFSDARDSVYIRAYGGTGSCQANAHVGTWATAYKQELAGIIGWSEGVEDAGLNVFEQGLTTLCVLYLDKTPPNGSRFINPYVCAHEADGIILAYNGQSATVGAGRMFRDTLYMHVSLRPLTATLSAGDSIQISADSFYSGGLGPGGPPALTEVRGHIPVSKPASGSSVTWFTRNTSVVQHHGSGWFVGGSIGTTWIGARASGTPSVATRWWYPLVQRGDSVQLTVQTPPNLPYVVTSDETPIWTAGYHQFTAHVGTSGSTIAWTIDDSRTLYINPDTSFTTVGQVATLYVAPGSYTLRFGVSAGSGGYSYQDIPVCTSGGGEALRMWDGGGATTDAVENCPPPGGGGGR